MSLSRSHLGPPRIKENPQLRTRGENRKGRQMKIAQIPVAAKVSSISVASLSAMSARAASKPRQRASESLPAKSFTRSRVSRT